MTDRIPCPVCKSPHTLEAILRDMIALAKQANHHPSAEVLGNLTMGLHYKAPPDPDKIEPLRPRVGMLNADVRELREELATAETCADCGVVYRPGLNAIRKHLESQREGLQRQHILDAIAREARSE